MAAVSHSFGAKAATQACDQIRAEDAFSQKASILFMLQLISLT